MRSRRPRARSRLLAGRYELGALLGEGRQGKVYRAKDHWGSVTVAIKLLAEGMSPSDVLPWAHLHHPNVVRVLDADLSPGKAYIAVEYVQDIGLREIYLSRGEPALLSLAADICHALQAAHSRGLIHGDLKPANVLVGHDLHRGLSARVTDFGLRRLGAGPDGFSGTLAYAAPEVLRGEPPDERSDLYSLGACLYEVVTGRPVFERADLRGVVRAHAEEPPPDLWELNPDVSPDLAATVAALLAKERTARPQSAGELMDRLGVVAASALRGEPAWVGRQRELTLISRLGELASESDGCVALLVGEDGMGKSALLDRVCLRWGLDGSPKLHLQCLEEEPDGDLGGELLRRARALAGVAAETTAASRQRARIGAKAFLDICRGLTEDKALLVALEDVGSAPVYFQAFLGALAPLLAGERIVMLATLNRSQLAELGGTVPELFRLPHVRRVALRPFSERETCALVASLLCRTEIEEGLCPLIHRSCGGNPELACEMVRHLVLEGRLYRHRGVWVAPSRPELESAEEGLASAIESKIRSLDADQRRVTGALALFGQCMSEDVLAAVVGFGRPRLTRALEGLHEAHIVRLRGEHWTLRNGLLAKAAQRVLSASEKRALHAAVAGVIEARWPGDLNRQVGLVRHLIGCGRRSAARERALSAGAQAGESGQYETALRLYGLAESLLRKRGDGGRRLAVLTGRARCQLELRRRREAVESLRKALALPQAAQLSVEETSRLMLALATTLGRLGTSEEGVALVDKVLAIPDLPEKVAVSALEAKAQLARRGYDWRQAEELARSCLARLDAASDTRLAASAENSLGVSLLMVGRLEEACGHLERACHLAQTAGATRDAAAFGKALAMVYTRCGRHDEAVTQYRKILATAEAAGLVDLQASVSIDIGIADRWRGALRDACRWFQKAEDLAVSCADRRLANMACVNFAQAKIALGESEQAEARLREVYAVGSRKDDPLLAGGASHGLASLYVRKGDLEAAEGWYAQAMKSAKTLGSPDKLGVTMLGRARLARLQGRLGEAEARLADARASLEQSGEWGLAVSGLCELAELTLAEGRSEEAVAVLEGVTGQTGGLGLLERAHFLRTLGRAQAGAGRHGDAAAAFKEGLELLDESEAVEEAALTRLEVGRWLMGDPQVPGFRPPESYLSLARDGFRGMGAQPQAKEAGELLNELSETSAAGLAIPTADVEKLGSLYRMVAMVNSARSSGELLPQVLDLAVHAVHGERGLVVLVDEETGDLVVRARTEIDGATIADACRISQSVVRQVAGRGEAVFSADALSDARFSDHDSVRLNRIACFMCVPLDLRGKVLGTIYVDSCSLAHRFSEQDVSYLRAFAHQVAIAMENVRLREELERENAYLQKRLEGKYAFETIVGRSPRMEEVFRVMAAVTGAPVPVLICGETGTGKELIASAIHHNGPRCKGRFVPVDCGGLPETLLESELFGYAKGAFTGAVTSATGLFRFADEGTIFLDEVGDMSPSLQAKLLRVLQTGEVRPVGSAKAVQVDVRVIAATNRDLDEEMQAGRFRDDLYYRLKGVTIAVPPLRERREDIPLLAAHFLDTSNQRLGKSIRRFSDSAAAYLCARPWPGNVRELERVVEAAVALCTRKVIDVDVLWTATGAPGFSPPTPGAGMTLREAQAAVEKQYALEGLRACQWNVTKAADWIGVPRRQLQRIMERHDLKRPRSPSPQ